MPAVIIINQPTKPPGGLGTSRDDLVTGLVVTATNNTAEGTYLWTLLDVPIRSALIRGTTGIAAAFTFTPDVKGTYRLALQVNGSAVPADNAVNFGAVLSFGAKTLGWRYLGAGESNNEDNIVKAGLGFPSNINPRGWATEQDLEQEQTELAAYEIANAVTVSPGIGPGLDRVVRLDPNTGKFDPSVVPGGAGDLNFSYKTVVAASTITIPNNQQMLVSGGMTVDGTVNLFGEIVLI